MRTPTTSSAPAPGSTARTWGARALLVAGWIATGSSPGLADAGHVPAEMVAVNARDAGLVASADPDRGVANANTATLNHLLMVYAEGGPQAPVDGSGPRTVFIPAGTYYFSDTVQFGRCKLRLLGAGADKTRLVLVPNADGFNGAGMKTFVRSASCLGTAGDGNKAVDNFIEHLTVDVGENANAVGLRFISANLGLLSDVDIRSASRNSGARGLEFVTNVGPTYIKNVSVRGFDVGVYMDRQSPNILTLVNVSVSGQGTAGLVNEAKNVTLENFSSTDNERGIVTRSDLAALVVLNGTFAARAGTSLPAIELASGGSAYLKDVSATGHSRLLANGNGVDTGGLNGVTEWSTLDLAVGNATRVARAGANMDGPGASRKPAVEPAPEFHEGSPDRHFIVTGMNPSPSVRGDDQAALLRAIEANRGKTTANVPRGHYSFRRGAFLGGGDLQLRKIDFNWSFLSKPSGPGEAFEIGDTAADYLIVENVFTNMRFVYSGSKKLVLRNIKSAGAREGSFTAVSSGTGTLFVETAGVGVNATVNPGSQITLRGIDRDGDTHLRNQGGRLLVIGDNVEINPAAPGVGPERLDLTTNPQIVTGAGGTTVVYGGTYDTNAITRRPEQGPLFVASGNDACVFVTAGGLNRLDGGGWGLWPRVISDNGVIKNSDDLRYFTRSGHRRLIVGPYRSACY